MAVDEARAQRAEWIRNRREARRLHAELLREISRDTFLQDWLEDALESESWLAHEKPSEAELENIALEDGFRTVRAWKQCREHGLQTVRRFVNEPAFKALWTILREYDRKDPLSLSYSPANGGVPMRLIRASTNWFKAPKFTSAQRRKHSKQVAGLCEELEQLLSQVIPSHDLDDQYARFRFPDTQQAEFLFRAFKTSHNELQKRAWPDIGWHAGARLAAAGIDPLWAVRNIKQMAAERGPSWTITPTKLHTQTAARTYFIRALDEAIRHATFTDPRSIGIGPQLMADITGLLADMDCSADDVRKALKDR